MNIQEAKETIEKALRAYFARDEIGFPLVPLRQQRPILLIGPPGIGKTAIMEQIAEECGVGLVAYTMTHHTRQSAMGLPEICTRGIEGKMVHTTEYTMSEIIASIYDCMEQTGKKRGILFLDEINCVSETLAPVMLKLLQDTCRNTGRTVIVITHNSALTAMADRVIHIKSGTVTAVETNPAPTPVERIEW